MKAMVKTVVGRNATILILTLGLVCSKEVFMEGQRRTYLDNVRKRSSELGVSSVSWSQNYGCFLGKKEQKEMSSHFSK